MEILIPILAVTVIGLICAVGLAVASSVMAVKEDTRFTEIRACLPGANCGACGYTGCDGYAKALLEPGTKTNLCVPGADAVAAQIAALLGVEAEDVVEKIAVVQCAGTCEATSVKADYRGILPGDFLDSLPEDRWVPLLRADLRSDGLPHLHGLHGLRRLRPGLPAERHLHAGRHRLRQPHRVHRLRHLRADLPAEDHRDRAGYHPHRGPLLELSQRPVHPQGLLLRLHRLA